MREILPKLTLGFVVVGVTFAVIGLTPIIGIAQVGVCKTVLDCANSMVDLANQLKAENIKLKDQIDSLKNAAGTENEARKKSILEIESQINLLGPEIFQCPRVNDGHDASSIGGGKWGFYGCQGQLTTQAFCVVIEEPNRQQYQCAKIGRVRLAK